MDSSDNRKKAMLEALENSNGIVLTACQATQIARSTFYQWLKDDAEFKEAVDDIQEVAIDFVESKLFEKINGVSATRREDAEGEPIIYEVPPSDTAIIFYLKTKAKQRGYIEKTQTELSGTLQTGPIQYVPQPGNEPVKD